MLVSASSRRKKRQLVDVDVGPSHLKGAVENTIMAIFTATWYSVFAFFASGSDAVGPFFRAAIETYGRDDVAAAFIVFLVAYMIPSGLLIVHFNHRGLFGSLLARYGRFHVRYRRGHTARVRYRHYRRLLLGVQRPPTLASYMPSRAHRWWSYLAAGFTSKPNDITRWRAPFLIVARRFSPTAHAEEQFEWWIWRIGHCHGQWRKRRPSRVARTRHLNTTQHRHPRMHGGSNSSHPEEGSSLEASAESFTTSSAHIPSTIPLNVVDRFVPDRTLPVTQALAQHPPMSREAQPLNFDNTCPVLVADEPNTLIAPAGSIDFARELSRLHLDLVWLSRHAVTLRRQLPQAEARGLRSLRVSETQRLPLWVISLANEILPVQELLARWDEGRRWLQRGGTAESELQSIDIALDLLDNIPWSARVPNQNRAIHLSTLELASLLSNRWLNDEILNAGNDWTIRRVAAEAAREQVALSTAIANVYFLPSLRNARSMHPAYRVRPRSALDQGIRTGSITRLHVPANPGGNHWAGYYIDLRSWTYTYIDSLGGSANARDIEHLNWYLHALRPDEPSNRRLARALQPAVVAPIQQDSFSCGVVYLDTLASLHAGTPAWSPARAREARIDWFIRLSSLFQETGSAVNGGTASDGADSDSSDSDDDDNEWDFVDGLEDVPLTSDHLVHGDEDDYTGGFSDASGDERGGHDGSMHDGISEPPSSSRPTSRPSSRSSSRFSTRSMSPDLPTSLFAAAVPRNSSSSTRKRVREDTDSSSSDSDSSEEARRVARQHRGRGSGRSKSWKHVKGLNNAVASGDFEANAAKLCSFRKKVLADDKHAEFKEKDIRAVRCSSCAEWIRMRVPYDVGRWREHRATTKCSKHQSSGLRSASLASFFSTPSDTDAPTTPHSTAPPLPCPGLRRERDTRIDRYLYRSMAAGGGAPSRHSLAFELFAHILSKKRCAWARLTPQRQRMVLRREEDRFAWRNSRASNAVFSSKCSDVSRSPPGTPEQDALPCAECDDLYLLHTFQVALNRSVPDEDNMKYVPTIYRFEELGDIYARIRGVKKLMESDGGKGFMLRFAQGYADGQYASQDVVIGMIEALVLKNDRERKGKSLVGMRYSEALDAFAQSLFTLSPHAYRIFRNSFAGRTESSLRSLRSKMPHFEPGFSEANLTRVAAYLAELRYSGPIALGWDDTELEEGVTVMQRTREFCVVVGTAAGPLEVRNEGDIDAVLRSLDPNTKLATKLRAYLIAIPLFRIPPILVALVARAGDESADELYELHERLAAMLHAHGIHPTSLSADGTETERALQRRIVESATGYIDFEIVVPETGCTLRYRIPTIYGLPFVITQDSKHAGKTSRNQLLTGARLLVIGAFCLHFGQLLALAEHSRSPLYLRDVHKVDKQDDRAAARLLSSEALDCLMQNFPEHRALAVYLFVMGELVDAWQNRKITHVERVRMVLRARYFLVAWRAHTSAHTEHRSDIQFISRESFDIFLILCDSLIQLIFVYREFYPTYPLLPWLHSTEMLEHFFGILRKLKADFNFADALWLEPKLRTLMLGAFKNLTPEQQANATAAGYWHTYLHAPDLDEAALRSSVTNAQFGEQAQLGLRDATVLLEYLGIDALDMLRAGAAPIFDLHAVPADEPEDHRPAITLHDLLNRVHPIATTSTEQEDTLEMTQYALVAQSTESTLNIMNLPDASPEEIDELRLSIAQVLDGVVIPAETPIAAVSDAERAARDLDNSSLVSGAQTQTFGPTLDRAALVGRRAAHQTRAASRAVRQVTAGFQAQTSRARKDRSGAPGTAEETLREKLLRNLLAKGISVQTGTGSTSGVGRVIRHTGLFSNDDGGARARQKAVTQGVAAQEFVSRRHPFFAPLQHAGVGIIPTADISDERPLCLGDFVAFLSPGPLDSEMPMLLGRVVVIYTNSGATGARHDYVTQVSSVGAPSYVGVQVFAPAYGNVYQSIANARLHSPTFMRVPRTHLILSFARDRAAISVSEIVGGNHPLVHCTLGAWSGPAMHHLLIQQPHFAQALRAMLKKPKKDKAAAA
ncbi:hypothetical protein PENSPDRAFT_610974 [Peniophora sp. CONT]|nr:hypothetical protein PENSPDRAFT_610974 [Peniophora sp. CONT]